MAQVTPTRDAQRLWTELGAARDRVLGVLEDLGAQNTAGTQAADALVALQEAANKLGVAEAALRGLAAAERPAPILDPATLPPPEGALPWNGEAEAALGLAEFTVPYAIDRADEVDRWLRVLRREGAAGRALADLGFPDGELAQCAQPARRNLEAFHTVRDRSAVLARHRGAAAVTTTDLLFAVLAHYGTLANRALSERGISRRDLLARLAGGVGTTAR